MRICDRRLLFVLDALLWIAEHAGEGRALPQRRLARLQGVPGRFLEHDLQRLVRAGILKGSRGPRGGYRLARPAETILLGEVIAAISTRGKAALEPDEVRSPFLRHAILPLFTELEDRIAALLSERTLADLIATARARAEPERLEDVA